MTDGREYWINTPKEPYIGWPVERIVNALISAKLGTQLPEVIVVCPCMESHVIPSGYAGLLDRNMVLHTAANGCGKLEGIKR